MSPSSLAEWIFAVVMLAGGLSIVILLALGGIPRRRRNQALLRTLERASELEKWKAEERMRIGNLASPKFPQE